MSQDEGLQADTPGQYNPITPYNEFTMSGGTFSYYFSYSED